MPTGFNNERPLLISKARLGAIATLALPIIGGMVSQNLLNLIDTAMVGSLGNAALAAVGLGGFVAFFANALVLGLSAGVQALASRRHGEGNFKTSAVALNAGLISTIVVGLPLSIVLTWLVPQLFPYLNSDPEVIAQGVPYLQARVLSIAFVGANMSFRGYWNGVGLSRLYLRSILIMHASNIFLNYGLIYGELGFPEFGVFGAGIGSAVSTVIGTMIYLGLGLGFARGNGFLKVWPDKKTFAALKHVALPAGVQQLFFSGGFVVLYWIIGQVGTPELAAANIMINILLVCILPGNGLGQTAATFVGQALGRNSVEDASQWAWDVVKVGVVLLGTLGLPMLLIPQVLAGLFISDPLTIQIASTPMRLSGLLMALEGVGLVLVFSLQGAGDARRTMFVSAGTQWLIMLHWLGSSVLS